MNHNERLPRLERLLLRPELEEQPKEVWRPTWRCFCCQDTGYVTDSLIRLVIPDYDSDFDRSVACQNCERVYVYAELVRDSLDWRFTPDTCEKLDRVYRDDWARTLKRKHELRKQAKELVDELAQRKSIRLRRRTSEEEMEVRRRHEEVIRMSDYY
ncbi:MAG: hypothetical protein QNJ53_23365 [Pleurocapsa sp. MO_192.B19]|nr:hypothetical protein [Pleurocapsa sp. MO_192.B19]